MAVSGLRALSAGPDPGCVGRTGWVVGVVGAVSSVTTTCRIAGAQPMFAVWPVWNDGVGGTAGAWLGWPDGVGPGSVVPVGAGVTGEVVVESPPGPSAGVAVGFTVGVAGVGLDCGVGSGVGLGCEVGGTAGAWLGWPGGVGPGSVVPVGFAVAGGGLDGGGSSVVGVSVGTSAAACGGEGCATGGRPGVEPPPLPGVPTDTVVGTVAASPCS